MVYTVGSIIVLCGEWNLLFERKVNIEQEVLVLTENMVTCNRSEGKNEEKRVESVFLIFDCMHTLNK